jgi:hypothetical protein
LVGQRQGSQSRTKKQIHEWENEEMRSRPQTNY